MPFAHYRQSARICEHQREHARRLQERCSKRPVLCRLRVAGMVRRRPKCRQPRSTKPSRGRERGRARERARVCVCAGRRAGTRARVHARWRAGTRGRVRVGARRRAQARPRGCAHTRPGPCQSPGGNFAGADFAVVKQGVGRGSMKTTRDTTGRRVRLRRRPNYGRSEGVAPARGSNGLSRYARVLLSLHEQCSNAPLRGSGKAKNRVYTLN